MLSFAISYLPDPHVRVPDRDVLALGEGDPEQAGGAVESRLDHVVEHEVRLDRGVVEIGAALPQDLGGVAPIPPRGSGGAALLRRPLPPRVALRERLGPSPV